MSVYSITVSLLSVACTFNQISADEIQMLKSLNIALEKMERRNAPWIRVLILLKSFLKLIFFSGSSWFSSPGGDVERNTEKGVGKVLLYFPHFTVLYWAPSLHQSLCWELDTIRKKSCDSFLYDAQEPAAAVSLDHSVSMQPGSPGREPVSSEAKGFFPR